MHGPGSTAKTGAKKDPLKTPPSHGFRDFAAIESGAKSRRFPVRGFGSVNERGADDCGQDTGRLQAVCRKSAASLLRRSPNLSAPQAKSQKPRPAQPHGPGFCCLAGHFRGLSRNRPKAWFLPLNPAQSPSADACMAPAPLQKQEQKKTPEKRLHRTVSGALLPSKQERNRAVSGARVRQCERARRERLRTGHGPLASGLPKKRRQPAAAKPAPIRAESQKPKAKSPARSTARPGFCCLAGRFQGLSRKRPKAWFLFLQTAQSPPAGACMAPVPLQKQEQKKTPEKRLYRTVSGALLLSKQEQKQGGFRGIGCRRFADGWPGGWVLR